jgi:hypothetical protein
MPVHLDPKVANGPKIVWLKMPVNSMVNRYTLYDHMDSECVMSVDDDIMIPHHGTRRLFEIWRGDYFQQIVGHLHYSRYHHHNGSHWRYGNNHSTMWSFSLTGGGGVYHRELLKHYMSARFRRAREIVDETRNCDDIMMNFLATKLSGRGPVVAEVLSWPEKKGAQLNNTEEQHLSERGDHYAARHRCIEDFFHIFGRESLVYTTSLFGKVGDWGASGLPGRHHYASEPPTEASWLATSEFGSWLA